MRTLTQDIAKALEKIYDPIEAMAIAKLLLCHFGELTPTELVLSNFTNLSPEANSRLQTAIRRLLLFEPIQYILGSEQFFNLSFEVTPAVLIPRPETAELVEMILSDYPSEAKSLLDIGTGSGCIAIALDKFGSFEDITAWDISPQALEVARRNNQQNGTNAAFVQRDILTTDGGEFQHKFEVIVSNPPYIAEEERMAMLSNVVEFEPHTALFVPDHDPLLFYHAIARFARQALTPDGSLYLEINQRFGNEIVAMLHSHGFDNVRLTKDIFGHDRMIKARRA